MLIQEAGGESDIPAEIKPSDTSVVTQVNYIISGLATDIKG